MRIPTIVVEEIVITAPLATIPIRFLATATVVITYTPNVFDLLLVVIFPNCFKIIVSRKFENRTTRGTSRASLAVRVHESRSRNRSPEITSR